MPTIYNIIEIRPNGLLADSLRVQVADTVVMGVTKEEAAATIQRLRSKSQENEKRKFALVVQ